MEKKDKAYPAQAYCGCCGRSITGGIWCEKCKTHVAVWEHNKPSWDCTYYAQFGVDCPFQDKETIT